MAYVSPELKQTLVNALKPIVKKYNLRATYKVDDHYSFVMTVRESKGTLMFADLVDNDRIVYRRQYKKDTLEYRFLKEVFSVVDSYNYDKSDAMSDYFDIGFYFDLSVGEFRKPYLGKIN